jgi:hypothetical protein
MGTRQKRGESVEHEQQPMSDEPSEEKMPSAESESSDRLRPRLADRFH